MVDVRFIDAVICEVLWRSPRWRYCTRRMNKDSVAEARPECPVSHPCLQLEMQSDVCAATQDMMPRQEASEDASTQIDDVAESCWRVHFGPKWHLKRIE